MKPGHGFALWRVWPGDRLISHIGDRRQITDSVKHEAQNEAGFNGNGHDSPRGKYLLYLALGALGVVYGDIGTSPLYAFRESFRGGNGLVVSHENVLGVLSLIFWSLLIVISGKYLLFVVRADNRGEGGILALTSLIFPRRGAAPSGMRNLLILCGLFGTALLYGDGMITPAISVLSAVEGLGVATPLFEPYVIPITIAILAALFLFQRRGTERVGKIFGPMTLRLVSDAGDPWPDLDRAPARCTRGRQSTPRRGFLSAQWISGISGPGLGLLGRHGWRGPLCRYGSLRQGTHPPGVVCAGLPGPLAQLLWPRCPTN